jgi:hypothetical protein
MGAMIAVHLVRSTTVASLGRDVRRVNLHGERLGVGAERAGDGAYDLTFAQSQPVELFDAHVA